MSQQIRALRKSSLLKDRPEKHKLDRNVQCLFPPKFRQNLFCSYGGEVESSTANQRPGQISLLADLHEKQTRWKTLILCTVLASCHVSSISAHLLLRFENV